MAQGREAVDWSAFLYELTTSSLRSEGSALNLPVSPPLPLGISHGGWVQPNVREYVLLQGSNVRICAYVGVRVCVYCPSAIRVMLSCDACR